MSPSQPKLRHWELEAGYVSGITIATHTRDVTWKGYVHHAAPDDPQYQITSDRSGYIAWHKASALKILED
jgi:hypothetical protein